LHSFNNKILENFEKVQPIDLDKKFWMLDREGVDLLSKMITMDPETRINCKDALSHVLISTLLNL